MTINLTEEHLYVGIILVLMAIQMYQQRKISKLEKEASELWDQIGILTHSITMKFMDVLKDLNAKQDKK